jgi:hypothetical protein
MLGMINQMLCLSPFLHIFQYISNNQIGIMKQLFIKALMDNNEEVLKHFSKIIAHSVRNEIEQFHVDYLTDEQMKELNPLIRNGIYNILFAVANCDGSKFCADYIKWHSIAIPPYWEEPELDTYLQNEIKQKDKRKITFQSAFLKAQFKLGNIIYQPISNIQAPQKPYHPFLFVFPANYVHHPK